MLKVHKFAYYLMVAVFFTSFPVLVVSYLSQDTVPAWTMAALIMFVSGSIWYRESKQNEGLAHHND